MGVTERTGRQLHVKKCRAGTCECAGVGSVCVQYEQMSSGAGIIFCTKEAVSG